ncbi:amidase family protein [Neisseria sp. 83E34]|uniref:amidase family protein n=1 Tax=Neisseria sp. 83E34 TaxID=1692264 RepID=UPI0018D0F02A|nr:amidase family protein [Neisseria sp. 83E34]
MTNTARWSASKHGSCIKTPPLQTGIIDERVAQRLQSNRIYPLHHLFELLTWRARLQRQLAEELQDALLLLPTTAIDAPPLARLENDREFFAEANRKILRNTMAGSFLDMPGLTIPTSLNRNGLPAALLISAASGRDEYVLHAGKIFAGLLTDDTALNRRRFE